MSPHLSGLNAAIAAPAALIRLPLSILRYAQQRTQCQFLVHQISEHERLPAYRWWYSGLIHHSGLLADQLAAVISALVETGGGSGPRIGIFEYSSRGIQASFFVNRLLFTQLTENSSTAFGDGTKACQA